MTISPALTINGDELEEKVKKRLTFFNLQEHHAEYCKQSFEKLRPRYHNELHCYSTALTFFDLAIEGRVGLDDARLGFVAALYHDANHLMAKTDRKNITSALRWVRRNDFFEESLDMNVLAKLIRVTDNTNVTFETKTEELLHDADVMQTVKGNVFENIYWQRKLAEELVCTIDVRSSIKFVKENVRAEETLQMFKKAFFNSRGEKQ